MNACDLETALMRATTTGTMLQEHELCFLYALAGMAPDGPAVECGVYKGGSLSVWCGARRNGTVYAVDTWRAPKWDYRGAFEAQIERHNLAVTVLQVESWDAPAVIDEPIAFCFIDSTHGEDGFSFDIAVWPDAMKRGGVLVFHDYDVWKPGVVVKQLVDRWQEGAHWYSLGRVGSAMGFMRPRGIAIGGTR